MNPEEPIGSHPPSSETEHTSFLEVSPLQVPLNLSEWVAPKLLTDWIQEAVADLDRTKREILGLPEPSTEFRPKVMLAVLLYAYATQVYMSEEITRACHSDANLRLLCEDKAPFAEELEHFRRKNRALIENLLTQILTRAVAEKFVDLGDLPRGLQYSLSGRAADRVDTARHMDRAG